MWRTEMHHHQEVLRDGIYHEMHRTALQHQRHAGLEPSCIIEELAEGDTTEDGCDMMQE